MLTFWIIAALLGALAAAVVIIPLLRPRSSSGPSSREANLAVLRGQRRDVDADIQHGLLPAEARDAVLAELAARAEEDLVPAAPAAASPAPSRAWIAALVFGLLVPLGALGLYAWVGSPLATDSAVVAQATAGAPQRDGQFSDAQIEAMVEGLDARMKDRPNDVEGWTLLARSLAAMGKTERALSAYRHLSTLQPDNPTILADYADMLALSKGRDLSGEPAQLVNKALQIDPRHPKALALAATARFNAGDFAASIALWERLFAVVPPGSEDAQEIRRIVDDVRARAAAAGKPQPPSRLDSSGPSAGRPPVPAAPAPAAVASGPSVSGSVRVDASIASRISPTDTVFIFARVPDGPRMPLAILRVGAGELPRAFELTDAMGMGSGPKLSGASSVVIEARVSKSGSAAPQPGDLVGTSGPVAPGARGVAVVINRVLP